MFLVKYLSTVILLCLCPYDVIFLFYSSYYTQPLSMLFSHLMAVSRARAPVLFLRQRPIVPIRYFSVSTNRTANTEVISSVKLDSLENSAAPIIDTNNKSEFVVDVPPTSTSPSDIFSEGANSALSSEIIDFTNLAEPSFTSLGLGHGWPSGWMQTVLEFMHIDIGLPWWQAIGLTTICLRCVVFPIMVIAQKNMVKLNEHQPAMQKLQVQGQLASVRGDVAGAAFANKALNSYMIANNCHPVKSMLPMVCQGAFFASMFFGLRGMTNAPVQSMTNGGIFWFSDLTLADPMCVLPVLTATTLFFQLYLGADGINTDTMPPFMKKLMFAMPLISVPVMINFPAALNVYWLSNNLISLAQSRVMKRQAVRTYFGIPEMTKWKPEDLPATQFHEELKREIAIQRRKTEKEEARKEREKKEAIAQEHKIRGRLLEKFEEEARIEAEKLRIADKENKS